MRLNQPAIDDGNRSDLDDLASVAEAVVLGEDFNTLVAPGTVFAQDPVRSGCSFCQFWSDYGYMARRDSRASRPIYWSGPRVLYARAVDNGFNVNVRLDDFDMPLQASGSLRECACGVQATQTTGLISGWAGLDQANASATIGVSPSSGRVTARVNSMSVNTTGLYLDIDCGWADFLCDAITDIVLPFVAGTVESALEDVIASEVVPLIEDFVEALEMDEPLHLPAPFDAPVSIWAKVAAIDLDGPAGTGNAEVALSVQTYPGLRADTTPETARGAIARSGPDPTFSSTQYALGFGLADDALNQLLWSVWYGGGLELDALEVQALSADDDTAGVSLQLSAALPMLMMPGDADHAIQVGLGDARVDAVVDLDSAFGLPGEGSVALTAYVSVLVGCDLGMDPTTNVITITALDADPELHVELVTINRPEHEALAHEALLSVLRKLVPQVADAIVGALPLPTIDLTSQANTTLELGDGELARPNASNACVAGTEDPSAARVCITGRIE